MKKLILLLLLCTVTGFAQPITWTDVTSQHQLPAGVKLFQGSRTNPVLKAFYLDVDLNNQNIAIRPYITSSTATVPALTQRFGAYAAINGGFFSGTTSLSTVVYPNQVMAQNVGALTRNQQTYPVIRSLFSLKSDRTMSVDWIYHFNATLAGLYSFNAPMPYTLNHPSPLPAPLQSQGAVMQNVLAGIGGGPTLVKNGAVNITYNEEIFWGSGVGADNRDPRTAVGYTANKHAILMVADGRLPGVSEGLSLSELANEFISLGCVEAMNLDGGGSSQMAIGSNYVNTPSTRAVPTIFAVVHKDSLQGSAQPLFEKIIDTGDPDAYLMGGDWFATANTGYYGTTPAMLNAVGTGISYAEFKSKLPETALYEVYGWWVASSNRCTNTPFIIKHKNGTDTVRVNQSTNGSQWVYLGKYTFSPDTSQSVTISDAGAGTAGTYVVADAVRLISFDNVFVDVQDAPQLPSAFLLEQNYPNPFNPETTVSFHLPRNEYTSLKVYNVLGKEVRSLVEGVTAAGTHRMQFNAEGLASGIYFLSLKTESFASVKKMTLIR